MQRYTKDQIAQRLSDTLRDFNTHSATQVGYPANLDHDYSDIQPFLQHSGNNIGDPFQGSNYRANTHDFEREVIGDFAELFHLEPEAAWGYVTSGGTEGNLYGLFMARETHPTGTVYFSQDTHYSIPKAVRILGMKSVTVRSQPNGQTDYQDLRTRLALNTKEAPAIIVANIGTTMKGAVDDLRSINVTLQELSIQHSYIHADAALGGMILPFVTHPQPHGFDAGIDSIAISGHKLMGAPVPCGVVLTLRSNVERVSSDVEYIGSMDTTIPGSRSAIAPLMIWHFLHTNGTAGVREIVGNMMSTAQYAVNRFNEAGIPAWRHANSPTVVLPRPSDEVLRKWQIATLDDVAHIIAMPHVTKHMVDALVHDCTTAERPAVSV